ncbi:MAG: prolyl oligopeptidase family serine peptidase [Actinomycetota bacterium]|nr:peptidase [Acidimicrobiaceae bacterium]MEC7916083.1 prolyl oligopeptidase family serine peptidase [Actinomycetota bacterium]
MKEDRPYGSWPSQLTSRELASGATRLSEARVFNGEVMWLEGRPAEAGRTALVKFDGTRCVTLGPEDLNVRTSVHEYGGGGWLPTNEGIWLSSFDDQRLWLLNNDFRPVTPEPATPRGLRFADGVEIPDSTDTIWVVERHRQNGSQPQNLLATVTTTGDVTEIVSGADFYSSPTISPDGRRLAYLSWNHPSMPWDHVRLHIAKRGPSGWTDHQVVLDGPALQKPRFSPDGRLHVISDATGWWNIHSVDITRGTSSPVCEAELEFGTPAWVFGQQTYAWAGNDLWCTWVDHGVGHIGQIVRSELIEVEFNLTEFNGLDVLDDGRAVTIAAGWETTSTVQALHNNGSSEQLSDSHPSLLTPDDISVPETITIANSSAETTYGFHFAPTNSNYLSSSGLPPLLVLSHGGPTGAARSSFDPVIQYWTNRGFAVVDVNYRGSTGFGTAYRNKLKGQWGVADTEDCVGAAQYLADTGAVDPERLVIKGGSAGGFTTLCALTKSTLFAAGISRYGVADLATLAQDTHKFEARYLDSLVGEWPSEKQIYDDRSPINHTDQLSTPMIVLQGSDDPVVPPSQAEQLVNALTEASIPHAYVLFEGESHGFRQAETISRALDAELSFLGQVLNFQPFDSIETVPISGIHP